MPFGAQCLDADRTRFRLWAPTARSVALELGRSHTELRAQPMRQLDDGWHELVTAAAAGARYRYRIDDELSVPDPASRFNPAGVHEPSEVIDSAAFDWTDGAWRGRPWHEAVLYETHVGTVSRTGDFAGLERRLDELVELGVTAIELLPVGAFSGARGWGYDGVLWYAPHARYGSPADLKRLVQAAHARGLMVVLDVVYNHFGPDGNYLPRYAAPFFNATYQTPWGDAINLDGAQSACVRSFIIHNALYWLNEYHFDGLRLDAVHALRDGSSPSLVEELARTVRAGPGRQRHVHLILENERNEARLLERAPSGAPLIATAQWNDDFHHAFHVILTGERDGYYADYAANPVDRLGRTLTQGFAYQGERSSFSGRTRGQPSAHLPPTAFIAFLQNHDQIGNRARGERLVALTSHEALRAAWRIMLLAPSPPMLFMGEESGVPTPFLYFCDYAGELGAAITAGRRREFARFAQFAGEHASGIPDPCAPETFERSRLGGAPIESLRAQVRDLLMQRHRRIVPLIPEIVAGAATYRVEDAWLHASWPLRTRRTLELHANLGHAPHPRLEPWQVRWTLDGAELG